MRLHDEEEAGEVAFGVEVFRTHQFSAAVPWEHRNASLFGRFSPYQRLSHLEVPETRKIGHRWGADKRLLGMG